MTKVKTYAEIFPTRTQEPEAYHVCCLYYLSFSFLFKVIKTLFALCYLIMSETSLIFESSVIVHETTTSLFNDTIVSVVIKEADKQGKSFILLMIYRVNGVSTHNKIQTITKHRNKQIQVGDSEGVQRVLKNVVSLVVGGIETRHE